MGAYRADPNGRLDAGAGYVVFGKRSTDRVDLAALGAAGFAIEGAASGDMAGVSVAGARDVNKDSRADLLVGAPFASNNSRGGSGSAYVVFGKKTADPVDLTATPSQTVGFRINGAAEGDQAGYSVAGVRDQNADGYPDVAIGAPLADNTRQTSGSGYVIFGATEAQTIELSSLGARGYRFDGATGDQLGHSAAGPGDVNRDGRPDVILGAPTGDSYRADAGSAYLLYGKRSLPPTDLGSLGSWGYRADGETAADQAGQSVGAAGDVNGDGRPDVIVGAPTADNNGRPGSGAAYVPFN